MPVVKLLDRRTSKAVVFLNVHNPADTRRYPHQGHWRSVAVSREVALVRHLTAAGARVIVTGDINDRHEVYCRLTAGGLTHSARGPVTGPGCRVPRKPEIDWIFGNRGITFSGYHRDHDPIVRWTTDHPLITARAQAG